MTDDKKGGGSAPNQPQREPAQKSDEGRSGRFNDGANRTTDWVKPERPTKK
jgi:hypothetical protein